MVVAGRVVAGGDVAIMMVEAEATDSVIELIAGGARRPTERSSPRDWRPPSRSSTLCAAQIALAEKAAKETADYPVFPDYADDVYTAVADVAGDPLSAALTIAGKQERDDRTNEIKGVMCWSGWARPSPAGRRKSVRHIAR
jgi:polyribonucleotide nucleotidyltransferase